VNYLLKGARVTHKKPIEFGGIGIKGGPHKYSQKDGQSNYSREALIDPQKE
jgi:hypothetical protein